MITFLVAYTALGCSVFALIFAKSKDFRKTFFDRSVLAEFNLVGVFVVRVGIVFSVVSLWFPLLFAVGFSSLMELKARLDSNG